MDETWFVDCDLEIAAKRMVLRHVSTGKTLEEAKYRVINNDGLNAEFVDSYKHRADLLFNSDF